MKVITKRKRWLALLLIAGAWIGSRALNTDARLHAQASGTSPAIAAGQMQASTAVMPAPARSTPTQLAEPPQFSAAQLALMEQALARINKAPGRGVQSAIADGPPVDSETAPGAAPGPARVTGNGVTPAAPGTLSVFLSSFLSPTTGKSSVNEPSLANLGGYVFYTGNWYAARSSVGGSGLGIAPPDWTYINPYAGFSDFCCDQDVIADRGRHIFLWYRQGNFSAATGQSRFALGISHDGVSFCTYFIRPVDVNGAWTNQWFDYPQLAVTNNFLYITTSMFSGAGGFLRQVILKWPLDALSNCAGFNYSYWDGNLSGWAGPAQGATTTEYWGDSLGTSNSMRVFWQPENSGTLSWVDRAITAFTFENGDGSCPGPDGGNWCSRSDSRIKAGWVRQPEYSGVGEVGFMWNAKQGGNFPVPYVEAATFRQDTLDYVSRPLIWSSNFTWHYPFASPNARGDLGVTVNGGSTSTYVSTLFAIDDDYNGTPPGWENVYLRVGAAGATAWGDYNRNRPHQPAGLTWVSAGHTNQGGATGIQPGLFNVGRERDLIAWVKHLWITFPRIFVP
jgi:hypothetical protein